MRMRLYRPISHALRQRHDTFSSTYSLSNVSSESVLRSSHHFCQKQNTFRIPVTGGSLHLPCPPVYGGTGYSHHSSDLWTKDWNASATYQKRQFKSAYITNAKDCKLLPVAGVQRRFIYGGPALWSLIAANLGVFAMWYRVDPRFMMKHFVLSPVNMISGRQYTLITSAISHMKTDHLLWNMIGLYCFGGIIDRLYGGLILLSLYAGAAVTGSFGHFVYFRRIYPWLKNIPIKTYDAMGIPSALGASGAVTGLTMLFILNYPTHTIFVMFFPMPAAIAGCIIVGRDVYLALKGDTDISVGAHLGGALYGTLVYSLTRLASF